MLYFNVLLKCLNQSGSADPNLSNVHHVTTPILLSHVNTGQLFRISQIGERILQAREFAFRS